jgi:hypothetical protein
LLIKAKQQPVKNQNKNTGLFINCMDFVVVRTKINKKKPYFFLLCLGLERLSAGSCFVTAFVEYGY